MKVRTSLYFLLLCIAVVLAPHAGHAQLRTVPDSVVKRMQTDRDFLYANDSDYWKEEKSDDGAFLKALSRIANSTFLRLLLYIFLAAIIIFAIYQVLVINNFFAFSKRRRIKPGDSADAIEDEMENIDEKLAIAIREGNYRTAVRFLYLKTLKQLNERQLISLHAKSTNEDYIRQLNAHRSQNDFRHLTRIYEYVWYGQFDPNNAQFDVIATRFNKFNSAA